MPFKVEIEKDHNLIRITALRDGAKVDAIAIGLDNVKMDDAIDA